MKRKYRVRLSEEERARIMKESEGRETPKTVKKRCSILMLADENAGKPPTQEEIAIRSGVSDVTVYHTVKGYATKGIEHVLRRTEHKEPPRKRIVTGEKEARIVALACGEAPDGYGRWTIRLLREKVIELEIVENIDRETIRTTLKKRNLSLT